MRLRMLPWSYYSKEAFHLMQTPAEKKVINSLLALQEREAFTGKDTLWAEYLGITQGYWSHIKHGHRGIGKRFAARILSRYPQLWRELADIFLP